MATKPVTPAMPEVVLSAATSEDEALEFLAAGNITVGEFKSWKDTLLLAAVYSETFHADTPLDVLRDFEAAKIAMVLAANNHGRRAMAQNGNWKNYVEHKVSEVIAVRIYLKNVK